MEQPHYAMIEHRILLLRGQTVMLDNDLASLYGVPTKALLQAVRRNSMRFPDDFMFQLNSAEWLSLRSQFVTSNSARGGRRYCPYAFTEQGVAMLSSVLSSPQAIAVNIEIMRAFVRLREVIASNQELAHRLNELERKNDELSSNLNLLEFETRLQLKQIFAALEKMMSQPSRTKKRPIGFVHPDEH